MLKCFDSSVLPQNTQKAGDASEATDIGTAIIQAVMMQWMYSADIINMSWTLNQDSEGLHGRFAMQRNKMSYRGGSRNLSLSTPLGSQVYPASWEEIVACQAWI
ncbi:MAG: hypothetical protein ACLURV_07030 [Gallintestinimicrobium sp.]